MFIPLRKADAAQRLVWGYIDETPDRVGEVFDYDSSKPNFEAWSGEMQKASGGLSYGNVRAMHGKVAAGKLASIAFDDAAKRIELCAHVVDDAEWEKVEQGVYTGFSPGGKYARRWRDGAHVRYTAAPSEVSLVDRGAIPTATFTMIKADGAAEERLFQVGTLEKGLYDVSRLADLVSSLVWLAQSAALEASVEQDGSTIPVRLRDWLATGVGILTDMAREEASEALADLAASVAKLPQPAETGADMAQADPTSDLAKAQDLAKAGARHSRADLERLQAIHDHAVGMGAVCDGAPAEKAEASGELAKLEGDLGAARDTLAKAEGERDALARRVAELEALPAPGGPVLKVLAKGDDVAEAGESDSQRLAKIDQLPPDRQVLELMKMAQEHPRPYRL